MLITALDIDETSEVRVLLKGEQYKLGLYISRIEFCSIVL